MRSSRAASIIGHSAHAYVLCEAQDSRGESRYRRLFLVDAEGQPITNELPVIIRAVACQIDEPRLALPSGYNKLVQQVHQRFEYEVRERQSELRQSSSRGLGREYVFQQLRALHDSALSDSIRELIAHLGNLFAYTPLSRRCHNELNGLRLRGMQGDDLVEQLRRIALDYGLENIYQTANDRNEVLITRIVCSEAFRSSVSN
ncbi:MAG: hypothetical protein ACYDBJ_02960 [Aggregatilineales bacterium]